MQPAIEPRRSGKGVALCAAALLLILAEVPALACSCAAPATPAEALARSAAVFAGEAVAIERPILERLGITRTGRFEVTFRVLRAWKGVAGPSVVVRARLQGEACGYPFLISVSYLVYAVDDSGEHVTGLCDGTREMAGAQADMDALDALAGGAGQ